MRSTDAESQAAQDAHVVPGPNGSFREVGHDSAPSAAVSHTERCPGNCSGGMITID